MGADIKTTAGAARAALDSLGVAHAHLSDAEVESRLRKAFGGGAAKKPAAPTTPQTDAGKQLAGELAGHLVRLEDDIRAVSDDQVTDIMERFGRMPLGERKAVLAAAGIRTRVNTNIDAKITLKNRLLGARQRVDAQNA